MHQLTLPSETCGSCTEDHELFHPAEGKLKPDPQPSALTRQHIAIFYLLEALICIVCGRRSSKNPPWRAVTAWDTLDAARPVWFDGYWGLRGHIVDMLVILDMAQVSVSPTSSGCLLLWRHLSLRALLTACDTPPDGLSWPKHFAKPTAHSKGQGGLSDSCNYTPRGVNHPLEK